MSKCVYRIYVENLRDFHLLTWEDGLIGKCLPSGDFLDFSDDKMVCSVEAAQSIAEELARLGRICIVYSDHARIKVVVPEEWLDILPFRKDLHTFCLNRDIPCTKK